MDTEAIYKASDKIGVAYRLFLAALVGKFALTLDQPNPHSEQARTRFGAISNGILLDSFLSMIDSVNTESKAQSEQAVIASGVTLSDPKREELSALMQESADSLTVILNNMMMTDTQKVAQDLRRFALEVAGLQGKGKNPVAAIIQAKYTRVSNIRFEQKDSIGRRWKSESFVQSMIRQHYILTYVDSYLFALAAGGQDLAQVSQGEGHRHDGLIFSISGQNVKYLSYLDIRDQVFHPNSAATVKSVVTL